MSDEEFRQAVEAAAGQGRQLKYIRLYKPDGASLGFSVVGMKSAHKGELGIYVQEIQPHGIAGQDGQLEEGKLTFITWDSSFDIQNVTT